MSEHFEHNPDDHEDPLTGPTWLLGIVGAVLLLVIVFGVTALYYNAQIQAEHEHVISREIRELREHNERQLSKLEGSPRWETRQLDDDDDDDEGEEVYIIPIEDAMQRVVEAYGR